ncbi:MAG TPA: Ppx/GppA phosphatase family protein [Hyphomonadaceae bacterium]|nr:Ppx/GppA phosphatase family protein [Hyphomonadaceae bacterium]HPI48916.1 Ppx/GppA phosphatase family protein [Hyphomonadaceae bacterium]
MTATSTTRSRTSGKPVRWKRIGVMDVGSNSVRLVVYDVRGRAMQPRFNEKVLAGLGRGLNSTGKLNKDGVEIAIAALSRFASITRAQKVEALFPFATAAVREAADGKEFADRVKKETGITLRVLSGTDEAKFAAEGVLAGTPGVDGVAGDLGGSSLELARLGSGRYEGGSTYPLGPLALDTGGAFNEDKVLAKVKDVLANAPELKKSGDTFFAVGGAWRAIGTLHMELTRAPLHMLQNYEMDAGELSKLLADILGGKKHTEVLLEVAKRRAITIPYAAAVLKTVLDIGKFKSVMISSYGVREGIIFDSLDPAERLEDPLDAGIEALIADEQAAEFGRALAEWASEAAPYTLNARLSSAACRLVDIGALLHPDHRADLAFDLVARAPLPGLSHRDRAALALAVASRFKKGVRNDVSEKLLDVHTAGKARALGALMRLAADFSGRSADLLKHARLTCDGDTLSLKVAAPYRALVSESVERRLEQAADELDMDYALTS